MSLAQFVFFTVVFEIKLGLKSQDVAAMFKAETKYVDIL